MSRSFPWKVALSPHAIRCRKSASSRSASSSMRFTEGGLLRSDEGDDADAAPAVAIAYPRQRGVSEICSTSEGWSLGRCFTSSLGTGRS
jgi:hypothetical protein